MFCENVRYVKNISCNSEKIETSGELWTLGISSLIQEITDAILDISKLQEEEKKT